MLSEEIILKLANKYQTIDLNVKREYFQHLFLFYFYQQPQASNICFKGGTALRIIYQSPRFSQDLDFNAESFSIKTIEEILLDTLSQIQKENVNVNIQESKKTSGGYLAIIDFANKISISLQISFRGGETKGEVVTIPNDFIPVYTVLALSADHLVREKTQALFDRKKPRDFYDLYFILRDPRLRPSLPKDQLSKALKILQALDINFEFELKQFLPRSHWMIIRDFKINLANEIKKFI